MLYSFEPLLVHIVDDLGNGDGVNNTYHQAPAVKLETVDGHLPNYIKINFK